jgi:hypothetical protein
MLFCQAYSIFNRDFPHSFKVAASLSDIVFMNAMGRAADAVANWGAKNIVLCPNGVCQKRFGSLPSTPESHEVDFDVVFIGSNTAPKNFLKGYYWGSKRRRQMIELLAKRYGKKFGLFGNGWAHLDCWQGPVPFSRQLEACQRGRIVFGGYPHVAKEAYYTSDRVFMQICSGIPFVDYHVPKTEQLLRNREHWFLVNDEDALIKACDMLLEQDKSERLGRASKTAEYVMEKHTQYHRMKFMLNTVLTYRRAKELGKLPPKPQLDFFLPEVDFAEESKIAIRNWEA